MTFIRGPYPNDNNNHMCRKLSDYRRVATSYFDSFGAEGKVTTVILIFDLQRNAHLTDSIISDPF